MAYKKTGDIIDRAREFHGKLADLFHTFSESAEKETVRMLLDYLGRHERHLELSLAQYEESASKQILETWFKYEPERATARCIDGVKFSPSMSIEEVTKMVLQLDDCLINLYREAAHNAQSQEVREVFRSLLEMEREEEIQVMRRAVELM